MHALTDYFAPLYPQNLANTESIAFNFVNKSEENSLANPHILI
jgi:hypothetical protein